MPLKMGIESDVDPRQIESMPILLEQRRTKKPRERILPSHRSYVSRNLAQAPVRAKAKKFRLLRMFISTSACLYVLAMLALWIGLRVAGDRWWAATLVLFGPRWVFILPYAALLPATLIFRLRSSWITIGGAGVTLFALMGFCLPWRGLIPNADGGPTLRVLSCNTHNEELDIPSFRRVMEAEQPDVIALQGWNGAQKAALFGEGEWYVQFDGELCVASRYPVGKREELVSPRKVPWRESAIRYDVKCPFGIIPLVDLHLASPHLPFLAVLTQSPDGPAQVHDNISNRLERSRMIGEKARAMGASVLLLGDFNTPPDSRVFAAGWSSFSDAFTSAGFGLGYTYFEGGTAARIDHVLMGSAWRCRKSWVGAKVGSKHRPLLADIQWVGEK